MTGFDATGWAILDGSDGLSAWLSEAREPAAAEVSDPANADWLRCGGTWFVGVNILPNTDAGRIGGSEALGHILAPQMAGLVRSFKSWDKAQISVIYPGYPRQGEDSDAAHRFRRDRDAAHVDGLLPVGPERRRMLKEPHGFVLGLPLNECDALASPMVVWEGSHKIIGDAFRKALADHAPEQWGQIDLTDMYHAARREALSICERVIVHVPYGQGYLMHRHVLHGVAPWGEGAIAPPEGRMIAYFRPEVSYETWIEP